MGIAFVVECIVIKNARKERNLHCVVVHITMHHLGLKTHSGSSDRTDPDVTIKANSIHDVVVPPAIVWRQPDSDVRNCTSWNVYLKLKFMQYPAIHTNYN